MKDFKELFEGVKHPSVHIFKERIAGFSAEEQSAYYEEAFRQSLCGFDRQSKCLQAFSCRLVHTHQQEFLTFLHNKTILGRFPYQLHDKVLIRKVVFLLEKDMVEGRRKDLAFALLLSFDYDLKISSFLQYAKTEVFDSADLAEVLLKLRVEN
jgi:hypothetical protein